LEIRNSCVRTFNFIAKYIARHKGKKRRRRKRRGQEDGDKDLAVDLSRFYCDAKSNIFGLK